MGLAQVVRLINRDPKHSKRRASLLEIFKSRLQPGFDFQLAFLHTDISAGLPMRQSVQGLGGMKRHSGADAIPQPVAQHQNSRHGRHLMAKTMVYVNQRSAARSEERRVGKEG